MRRTYQQFARLVERARREVLREMGDPRIQVIALSVDARFANQPVWGEFYVPAGPIVLYQVAYEAMPDQERYYLQIKDVLRHEYRHAQGDDNGEGAMPVWTPSSQPVGWTGHGPLTVQAGDWLVTLP